MNVRRTRLTARLKPRLAALRWGGSLGAGLLALAFGNVALGGAAGGVEVAGRKAGVECWNPAYVTTPRTDAAVGALTSLKTVQLSHGADYDRVVFEFNSAVGHPGAAISVVAPNSFTGFGGTPLTLAGVSAVAINFTGATHYQYYDARGNGRLTGGTTNVAEVVNTISLNDTGSWGIAMKEKAGYKATWLENPTRLVIDVQSAPDSGVPEFLTWNAVPFSEGGTPAAVASTRSGAHLDYDRVVLDYADGPIGSINVACGYNAAGVPIVKVTARVAAATPLVAPQVATWWSVVLRDVTATRDGTTPDLVTYSLVLDGTRPQFRIFTLSGANRLVIDVRPGA